VTTLSITYSSTVVQVILARAGGRVQRERAYPEHPMANPALSITTDDAPPAGAALRRPLVPGAGVLALLALAWLAAMLWTTEGTVGWAVDRDGFAVVAAAQALPGVVVAALVAGAALGLGAVNVLAARRGTGNPGKPASPGRWPVRLAAGGGAGLVIGAAVATAIMLGYDNLPSMTAVAVTVGVVATIGGALAALPALRVVAAGVAGALGVLAVTLLLNNFSHDLSQLYGARDSAASRVTANNWLALTISLLCGLVAGVLGYAYLRRQRATDAPARWPAYLLAGGLCGLLTAFAELATRLGGAGLLRAASRVSEADDAYLGYLNSARVNRAMVILFVGAIAALVLFGRTLKPPTEAAEASEPAEDAEPAASNDAE
jgi:hypothetical protein